MPNLSNSARPPSQVTTEGYCLDLGPGHLENEESRLMFCMVARNGQSTQRESQAV